MTRSGAELGKAWGAPLSEWAIPDGLQARVEESPWRGPTETFKGQALGDSRGHDLTTPSWSVAAAALRPRGSVLDIGAGIGNASLPLAALIDHLTAVDRNAESLAILAQRAGNTVRHSLTHGSWPEIAADVGPHDVVMCHHVVYDVPVIVPFVVEATLHARRVVVVELTEEHPGALLRPLWRHFHNIERPAGPTWRDFVTILKAIGVSPTVQRWTKTPKALSSHERAEMARRSLCLPPDRHDEVRALLPRLARRRKIVTLSWPGRATANASATTTSR